MTPNNVNRLRFAFAVAVMAASGCAKDSSMTSPSTDEATAQFATSKDGAQLVVTRTEDRNGEMSFDTRFVNTWSYDQRGHLMKEVFDQDYHIDGSIDVRGTTVWTRNHRGSVVTSTSEYDAFADGVVDQIYSWTTVEFDKRGYSTKMLNATDVGADGSIDSEYEYTYEYDANGNLSRSGVFTYVYDAHGNQIEEYIGGRLAKVSEYSPHDALVHQSIDWLEFGQDELSTLQYDDRGNPTRQVLVRSNSAGIVERITSTISYDGHRNPVRIVQEVDFQGDGNIDGTRTITYQYAGPGQHLSDLDPGSRANRSPAPMITAESDYSRARGGSHATD